MRIPLVKQDRADIHMDQVVLALLIGSVVLNVYLGVGRRPGRSPAVEPGELLKAGTQAPAFDARDLKGSAVSLKYDADSHATLLYVFSPTCHWCERNLPNLTTIMKTRSDLHIVGVALSGDSQQLANAEQLFPVVVRPMPETIKAYKLSATPTTILVSPEGRIVRVWPGAYGGLLAEDVSKVLAVSLPGLSEQ